MIRASVNLMKYVSQERNAEEGEEEDAVVNVCEDTKKRLRYAPAPRAAKAARPGHECIVDRYEHVFELVHLKIYYSNVPGLLAMGVSPGALQRAGVPASLLPGDSIDAFTRVDKRGRDCCRRRTRRRTRRFPRQYAQD